MEQADRAVTKAELVDHVWGDRFISEAALTSRLMAARKALGDSGQEQRYIKTVHGRGYRFAMVPTRVAAPVAREGRRPAMRQPEPVETERVRTRIVEQQVGGEKVLG